MGVGGREGRQGEACSWQAPPVHNWTSGLQGLWGHTQNMSQSGSATGPGSQGCHPRTPLHPWLKAALRSLNCRLRQHPAAGVHPRAVWVNPRGEQLRQHIRFDGCSAQDIGSFGTHSKLLFIFLIRRKVNELSCPKRKCSSI